MHNIHLYRILKFDKPQIQFFQFFLFIYGISMMLLGWITTGTTGHYLFCLNDYFKINSVKIPTISI